MDGTLGSCRKCDRQPETAPLGSARRFSGGRQQGISMRNLKWGASAVLVGAVLLACFSEAQAKPWTIFDVPNGNGTLAGRINSHNEVVGSTNSRRLFTRTKDGTIFVFGGLNDEVITVNAQDVVIGDMTTNNSQFYGFYMGPDQQIHQFGVQGANMTYPSAINKKG